MSTRHLIGLLCASGALVVANAALAQQEDEEREEGQAQLEEMIVIEAPRVVRQQVGRSPTTGAPVELISLSRRVSYADLDLQMHADVMELERRINDTAEEACMQLAELYPLGDTDMPTCVRQAVAGAMEQAEEAIAAAGDRAARRR